MGTNAPLESESDMTGPATTFRDIQASHESPGLAPDEHRANQLALYRARVVRLGDELEHMSKLISWARECLENELMSGMGYKKLGISDKDLQKLSNLSTSLERAVSAKIRYDKAAKDMADHMSPQDEFDAMWAFVKTLDREKLQWMYTHIYDLKEHHSRAAKP